jgi:Ni/Co efflux regulator RcnB
MRSFAGVLTGLALGMVLAPGISGAQNALGELLDAGAKRITPAEFRQGVTQRTLVGPTNTGAPLEVMYAANGSIVGKGANPLDTSGSYRQVGVSGTWTIDEAERVCTAMTSAGIVFPQRCQYWFKLGDAYYIADSDVDRHAKALRRSIKDGSTPTAIPNNLGELLDAGAKRLTGDEFKRDVIQRTIVGLTATGHRFEIMFAANGSVSGSGVSPRDPPQAPKADNPISGEWRVGEAERICTNLRLISNTGAVVLPAECQSWFKLGGDYFVANSDSDRSTKVLLRSVRTGATRTTTPRNLGELLDAGAKRLSADEFKQDIVQHTIIGARPASSGEMEVMYAINGSLQGMAQPSENYPWNSTVSGGWKLADGDRICTAMQFGGGSGRVVALPERCQYWFKLGDAYYISDSDVDRNAKVLRRSVRAGAAQTGTPSNLGELLDVGAKMLSADEFRQQVIRQVLVGSIPSVGTIELVYTTDGNLQGVSWPSPDAIKFMEAAPLTGQWTIDQMGRVCTSIQVTRMQTPPRPGVNLPPRCQFWFKQGGQYFLSDSDSERRAQVFPRAIKP